ncbi:glycosyltransferase [Mucilaginibacter arboris]|uniref:Glycosyltransferase n=1 Tax=Mucilaginibacter arboris TaxID=2682090 RepID=A0A7K1SXJ8_9SPHI|nr:glycosyltransferase family 2 protein [Mucilaginibacter arboris]MVN22044.1 glycosyltransferase [Mucilaginibacter arboris]
MQGTKNTYSNLAIVIPAYKGFFFVETIESIANQTCKDFTLYIGNDNSPDDLHSIIKKYENRISIVYKAFDENIGNRNLIAHWNRCIEMVKDEGWIWLFSDDDIMGLNCVERFYGFINNQFDVDLLHFDINIIDKNGHKIKKIKPFPFHTSITDFFLKRIKHEINSTVVEYIFKKDKYSEHGGFEYYDLAWCSDDATWIKIGKDKGIVTIPGATIEYRYSEINISAIVKDKLIILRKLKSNVAYLKWVKNYFEKNHIIDNSTQFDKLKWGIYPLLLTSNFRLKEKIKFSFEVIKELKYTNKKILILIYILYLQMKMNLLGNKS